jgi:transporter family-2 protein
VNAWLIVFLSLASGALLSAQGPILSRLAGFVGGPLQAAIVAFAIGICALVAVVLISGAGMPRIGGLVRMPAWVWAGGLIGTSLLVLTLYAVPRVGVTVFVAAVVCGQLAAALAYDHFGAFGTAARPIGLRELVGVTFLLAGLGLILWRNPA